MQQFNTRRGYEGYGGANPAFLSLRSRNVPRQGLGLQRGNAPLRHPPPANVAVAPNVGPTINRPNPRNLPRVRSEPNVHQLNDMERGNPPNRGDIPQNNFMAPNDNTDSDFDRYTTVDEFEEEYSYDVDSNRQPHNFGAAGRNNIPPATNFAPPFATARYVEATYFPGAPPYTNQQNTPNFSPHYGQRFESHTALPRRAPQNSSPRMDRSPEPQTRAPQQNSPRANTDTLSFSSQQVQWLLKQQNSNSAPKLRRLPTFGGDLVENPERFIQACETSFRDSKMDILDWPWLAQEQLRGAAAAFWQPYAVMYPTWQLFCEKLLKKYNNEAVLGKVSVEFYSRYQTSQENPEAFLTRKNQLYRRLFPADEEIPKGLLPLLREQLRDIYQPYLIGVNFTSLDHLMEVASLLDTKLAFSPKYVNPRISAPANQNRPAPKPSVEVTAPMAPQCRYCPERHLHKDCPVLNERIEKRRATGKPVFSYLQAEELDAEVVLSDAIDLTDNNMDELPMLSQIKTGPELPRISLKLANQEVVAALDSCASQNFLEKALIPAEVMINQRVHFPAATLGDGQSTLQILGTINVPVQIQKWAGQIKFSVVGQLAERMILGYNFLKEQQAVNDFHRQCTMFGIETRQTVYWVTAPPIMQNLPFPIENWSTDLPSEWDEKLRKKIAENSDLFVIEKALPRTNSLKCDITPDTDAPIVTKPYTYNEERRKIIDTHTAKMRELDVIEPTTSLHHSPIVIVLKPGKEPRFCIDFRKLNDHVRDIQFPMPDTHGTIRRLGQASYYSKLDLKKGYWQIPLTEKSKPLTAFSVPNGATYQFKVMPFGLKNAPRLFQQLMTQEVLAGYIGLFVEVYLDDVIIFSTDAAQHVEHVTRVLERLRTFRLIAHPEKCVFGVTKVPFLGRILSAAGLETTPESVQAVTTAQPPRTKKQLQSFLGLCGWIRDYVPNAAKLLTPLTDLLKQQRWRWSPELLATFEQIKHEFGQIKALTRPNFEVPFILQTDASSIGCAAVLLQEVDGKMNIVQYASAKFTDREQKWHSNEQECFALVWAMEKFRPYLEGRKFKVRTDNNALVWLNSAKSQKMKFVRWAIQLAEFDFTIEHISGKTNCLPDALSRHPQNQPPNVEEMPERMFAPTMSLIQVDSHLLEVIKMAQESDDELQGIIQSIDQLRTKTEPTVAEKKVLQNFVLRENLLFRKFGDAERLLIPPSAIDDVLQDFHYATHANHPGIAETLHAIQKYCWWPTMHSDVYDHVVACDPCQRHKFGGRVGKAPLHHRQPQQPFQAISIDLMGPYPRSTKGNIYLLTLVDLFTRWPEAYPLRKATTAIIIAKLKNEFFSRFGVPEIIIADNGPQFRANFDRWCAKNGVKVEHTPTYHPRANPVERKNASIKEGLKLLLANANQWDADLDVVLFTLRTRTNQTTKYSPAELLLGIPLIKPGEWSLKSACQPTNENPPLQIEIRHQARENQSLAIQHRGKNSTKSPPALPIKSLVLVKSHALSDASKKFHAGFQPKWNGPFEIAAQDTADIYMVLVDGTEVKVHRDQLKPYRQ